MKCHFCHKRKGEIPISDDKGKQFLICEDCDNDLFDASTLAKKLTTEINIQIRHHREEGNVPAMNSLKHIRDLILK
jgi:protein-arginine kinase activator protein McsA